MSEKIKILSPDQYSKLLEISPRASSDNVRIYLATVLPGLFYSITDRIINKVEDKFIYIPPDLLGNGYSAHVFENLAYRKIDLRPSGIRIDDNIFWPIAVNDMVVGGMFGDKSAFEKCKLTEMLETYAIRDYFNLVFNVADRRGSHESAAAKLFNRLISEKTFDSFMRSLPEWMTDEIGGGLAAFYYGSGENFILRKISGDLGHYDKMPVTIKDEAASGYRQAIEAKNIFIPDSLVPKYGTELKYPPQIRFVLGRSIDNELSFMLTGNVPGFNGYAGAIFLEELNGLLQDLSYQDFIKVSDWGRLFMSLDELARTSHSDQQVALFLLNRLNEYININRVSLAKYYPLENRIEVTGAAGLAGESMLGQSAILPVTGTDFERAIESGQPVFSEVSLNKLDSRLYSQLYKEGVRTFVVLPVLYDDSVYGFINIGSPLIGPYLKRFLPMLEVVADFMAKLKDIHIKNHTIEVLTDQMEQLQSKLSSVENIRTQGELASGVFHDLNNTIGAILGRCQLILQKTEGLTEDELIEKISRDAKIIEKSAVDSGEILNRLRELAKTRRKSNRVILDIKELINDSIEMVRPRWQRLLQKKEIKLTLHRNVDDNIFVSADPSEIREVFTNLLLNALDAMPDGGKISINGIVQEKSVHIEIKDTGTGIEPDALENIFDPFYTTKGDKGTGLGLALSRKIIESHSGKITVDSIPGSGTTFNISLPIACPEEQKIPGNKRTSGNCGELKVLIVEDSSELQDTISEILTGRGMHVSAASSGEEVIKLCGNSRYDVFIIDLGLPGMSGLDLATHVKMIDKEARIILTSGWEINESISSLISRGVDIFLAKPFRLDAIIGAIDDLLDTDKNPPG